MQNAIKILSLVLFVFVAGLFIGNTFGSRKVKSLETEINSYKESLTKLTSELTSLKESHEVEQGKEVVKRHIEVRPDGTQIISEDIVRDFFIEKKLKEAVVLKEQYEKSESENVMLRQKLEEFKTPEFSFTLIPSYRFEQKDMIYTISIQKRVFWECYLGLSYDKERVGVPLTCNF